MDNTWIFCGMVKMMITVVIIYALCWLPLHIVTLVGDSYPEIWTFRYIQVVWIGSHWLAMSNCCYNPMVYCWMNARFRSGFKYVFRWCPCVDLDNNSSKQKVRQMHTFVQPADQNAAGHGGGVGAGVGGGLRVNKPRTNRNSPYTPPTRGGGGGGGGGGIYQGETYSSYYSNESIAMQPTCKMKNGSGERTVAKCRLAPDGPFTGNNNFNGYERLSLSNSSEMA